MDSQEAIQYLTIAYVAQTKKWYEDHPEYNMPDFDEEDSDVLWSEFLEIEKVNVNGVIVDVVEQVGGGEGSGEHMHVVFSFTFPDSTVEYWRKNGYYVSFDGSYWDGAFVKVTPVQRVVTFYE